MSLVKVIRRYLFISILAVFLLGCISHFFIFRHFIHYSNDKTLHEQRARIESYIHKNDTLPLAPTLVLKPARIEVRDTNAPREKEVLKDTVLYSEETGTFTPYRQLYFTAEYGGKYHLITLNQPSVASGGLFYAIISSLVVLLVLLMLFTYVIEYLLKKSIWRPLDNNLQKLALYDLKANTVLELEDSGIEEFDRLNDMIRRMVDKINADYDNSRLFTEDASHEMQTPLSIIKSKLDLLLQSTAITGDPANERALQAVSRAVLRLSRLNRSLLLITRINNNQYSERQDIHLDEKLRDYLCDLTEILEDKSLTLTVDILPCSLFINPDLAEILLSNLMGNAVRHNLRDGSISVRLNPAGLSIENTCEPGTHRGENLFNRITFHNRSKESLGLGLNIVKSICDANGFDIRYEYPEDNRFRITVAF